MKMKFKDIPIGGTFEYFGKSYVKLPNITYLLSDYYTFDNCMYVHKDNWDDDYECPKTILSMMGDNNEVTLQKDKNAQLRLEF